MTRTHACFENRLRVFNAPTEPRRLAYPNLKTPQLKQPQHNKVYLGAFSRSLKSEENFVVFEDVIVFFHFKSTVLTAKKSSKLFE